MIYLTEATQDWERNGNWRVAPDGLPWIKKDSWIIVGNEASIGDDARIGPNGQDAIDIGYVDGFRMCIAQVNGVAYIGSGCRWFTLLEALERWSGKEDRVMTMCLLQSAVAIAGLKGWKHD
jgi:hypothetical protein